MMNNTEENIKQYFQETDDIPDLTEEQIRNIHEQIEENKNKTINISLFRAILISVCCILIITPCVLIPIFSLNSKQPNNPSEIYYTDSTANQVVLSYDYASNFIETNFAKYNFIFTECEFEDIVGYFDEKENLLAIELTMIKYDPPFTDIKFVLTISKNFIYNDHKNFVNTENIIQNQDYTLYKTENEIFYDITFYGLFDYEDYNLYLIVNRTDNEFFEKFL